MRSGIEIQHVSKSYPGVKAVDDISLAVRSGEIVGLVGHNGAGKSTLTRMLAGAERADAGQIYLDGEPAHFRMLTEAIRRGVVLVPQQTMIVPHLSVRENLTLGTAAVGARTARSAGRTSVNGVRAEEAVLEGMVRDLGLGVNLSVRAERLRPAAQRLIMIGRALLSRPLVLILDEPTAALSRPEVERLFAILRTMRDRGIAVLYISHRLEEVLELADRIIVMRQGQIVHEAEAGTLTTANLADMIVGRHTEATAGKQHGKTMTGAGLLQCDHLTKIPKIRDVTFTVHEGEVLGITGLVGSGRTSLLRMICGIDAPDSGRLYIKQKAVKLTSPAKAIRAGIAYLPEDRGRNAIVPDMRVVENVSLPIVDTFRYARWFPLLDLGKERSKVAAVLQRLQIQPPRPERRKIKFLSGGNQQKAVLARWLLTGAQVFIFDEPTEGIDVGARQDVYGLIRDLATRGAGVIVSSSDIAEIVTICDRVLVMRRGEIGEVFEGERILESAIKHACLAQS